MEPTCVSDTVTIEDQRSNLHVAKPHRNPQRNGVCGELTVDRRVLACLDGYMNIALEQTEEYVNGQLKNKYGDAFIRGNNVLYISTQKRRV
ncbi:hypothetical protein ANN_16618 [Periplaneta americana]|uniref:Sm domain-containing protein n=1 Tax=Periplaneta americana TaxID=6978 RepID=A0ABQ8SQW7_PERAM|nr:hypothetical protein ANN_16618 [Periplaneta americana]